MPALIATRDALDRFHAMMRSKEKARLDPWIAMAAKTKLAAFAASVEADKNAMTAAISTPRSSRQVEGKVNRLKVITRQMVLGAPKSTCSKPGLWPNMSRIARNVSQTQICTPFDTMSA